MNGGGTVVAQQKNAVETRKLATDLNSYRIGIVADQLLSMFSSKDDPQKFFHLCLSLARGIDYGVANNEPPAQAFKLTPVLKQVCCRKREFYLQSAIMVLMVSVKNACKLGWFCPQETDELLALADEVGDYFCTSRDINRETSVLMPFLSSVMSRYYPAYKLGHVITSFEVKPGYGTYLEDFHITKDLLISKDERIRLLVAMKDNVETSSCLISPQQVNILLNGRPVEKRTNVQTDAGPQIPTMVNNLLKYGTNLLQAVGQFNGHYILAIAAMSTVQSSKLSAPQDYVQPDTTLSGTDSEVVEGASRISLNCPISYKRINIPAKGHLCKHYQCFDLSNYVEINSKRPIWRCPHCNQSVGFTDLRVDRMIVKILQEMGDNVSEVTIDADGSWKVASSNAKDGSCDQTTNKQSEHEVDDYSGKSDGHCNVFDLTGEDNEMDTSDGHEFIDQKPIVNHNIQSQPVVNHNIQSQPVVNHNIQRQPIVNHNIHSQPVVNHNIQCQPVFSNSALPSNPRSANDLLQYPFSQAPNGLSPGSFSCDTGHTNHSVGLPPVLTDAVSPSLNRNPSNFQGINYPINSGGVSQLSPTDNLQLQEVFYGRTIPRNVTRVPSSIQALPVQMPTPSSQQYGRPIMSPPSGNGSSVPFQMPLESTQPVSNTERQRQFLQLQLQLNAHQVSSMPTASLQNRAASQGVGMPAPSFNSWAHQQRSQPPHLMRSPQTLSQPPHLARSSQLPRHHPQQGVVPVGVGSNNSPSTVQRVELTSQQPSQQSQLRQRPTLPSQSHLSRTSSALPLNSGLTSSSQPHLARTSSASPLNPGSMPQAVSRTENLIDIHQVEQTWRPTGRMRGALTGQAYNTALNQFMVPGSMTSPRPPATSTVDNFQSLMAANRMINQATQNQKRLTPDRGSNMETNGTPGEGS